jgi:hypothetical protein
MQTPSPPAPRRSPVPGVIPEPVRVIDDALDAHAGGTPSPAVDAISDRPASPRRRHAVANPLARLLSVIRGDRYMADAYDVPAPRAPRPGSQTKEG